MSLQALVLCSDEKILRVLRRVLSDLEVKVEHCTERDAAIRKLTRDRFEAVIVDCADQDTAALVLKSARSAPCNRRAVAVAIIDGASAVRGAFELGAHFVLYKPLSSERAKSSFRAARALMKSERRRNVRVAVQIPVIMRGSEAGANMKVTTVDLSEGGMAVVLPNRKRPTGRWQIAFTLPGYSTPLWVPVQCAWEGTKEQAGIRFLQTSPEVALQLRDWLKRNSPDAEQDDPPIRCQLTDLSVGGCYLEISSPFPVSSRLVLSMRAAGVELRAQGVVRIMHPDQGMGVEFTQNTREHRAALEKFLNVLTENRNLLPELFVQPEGLDVESQRTPAVTSDIEDPLLQLFYGEPVSVEVFHEALRKQRAIPAVVASAQASAAHA